MTSNEFDDARENHAENVPAKETVAQVGGTQVLRRARRWVMAAGILAGLLAYAIGEATHELIPAENGKIVTMGNIVLAPTGETTGVAQTRNAALTFGALGICLGGCLGMAGGLARRSPAGGMLAAGLGAMIGAAAGAGISLALIPFFLKIQPDHLDYELIIAALMHGAIWGPTGAAAGLAFAVGLGERKFVGRMLAAGLGGAVLGTIAYDLIAAAVFPLANTAEPISTTWPSRLLARMLVAVATAAALGVGLRPRRSP